MRTSAHTSCIFNYSFFKKDIYETLLGKEVPVIRKIAILNEIYKSTFLEEFQKRIKLKRPYETDEIWEMFTQLIEPLGFFQKEFIYHSNITMNNIIYDKEKNKYMLTDF